MYVFPTMPSLWPVVHNLIPVHCITAFCSDALVIWAQPLSAHGFKWLVLVQKNSLSFRPCFVPRSIFFSTTSKHLTPPPKNPIKISRSSMGPMGPSSLPSFVPLKGVIGTLSSFGDSFFVKEFRIGRDSRNCIQNLGNNFEAIKPAKSLLSERNTNVWHIFSSCTS